MNFNLTLLVLFASYKLFAIKTGNKKYKLLSKEKDKSKTKSFVEMYFDSFLKENDENEIKEHVIDALQDKSLQKFHSIYLKNNACFDLDFSKESYEIIEDLFRFVQEHYIDDYNDLKQLFIGRRICFDKFLQKNYKNIALNSKNLNDLQIVKRYMSRQSKILSNTKIRTLFDLSNDFENIYILKYLPEKEDKQKLPDINENSIFKMSRFLFEISRKFEDINFNRMTLNNYLQGYEKLKLHFELVILYETLFKVFEDFFEDKIKRRFGNTTKNFELKESDTPVKILFYILEEIIFTKFAKNTEDDFFITKYYEIISSMVTNYVAINYIISSNAKREVFVLQKIRNV
ncbi:hypothetical protein EHP00_1697 [Ecytonucleospora hepatopenaei]|uniref:Uncharacterized protein n=1 Tax=Ecytonucleospora hepatopenaei TaxID=646526 RepID=A0A1W0E488_9MICR|nr:hypothetical protein EHP00_1697 [Ecytonucleospora hepatopenaei]